MVIGQQSRTGQRVVSRQEALSFDAFGNPAIPHRTDTDAGTLRIVSSWPMPEGTGRSEAGPTEPVSGDLTVAVRLALELAGSAAGGFALEYDALDNSNPAYPNVWDATSEVANANRALDDLATVAFIGGSQTGALQQSVPILSRAVPPLAVVAPAATWPGLTRRITGVTEAGEPGRYAPTGVRNVARFGHSDDRQGEVAARWALGPANRRVAAVFHDNSRYGRCVALGFASAFAAAGGTVTATSALPADPINFDRYVASVAASGTDCVFLGGIASPSLGQFIGELRRQSSVEELTIMGSDGLVSDDLLAAIPSGLAEGLTAIGPVLPGDLSGDGIVWTRLMRERIGQDRDPDPFAVHAFEATVALIQAIDAVGSGDRDEILTAIQATRDVRGLTGTISLDAAGDRELVPYRLAEVQGNRFVTITGMED